MTVITTNSSNNPLKVTLLLSTLLHVAGFYILSIIPFNLTSRSPDVVPIKVKTLGEKKGDTSREYETCHSTEPETINPFA